MRQAASVSILQQLDAFGKAFAEPCNVALFVDLFAAAFEATSISFTGFLQTFFRRTALKTPPQPGNSRLMQEHVLLFVQPKEWVSVNLDDNPFGCSSARVATMYKLSSTAWRAVGSQSAPKEFEVLFLKKDTGKARLVSRVKVVQS